MIFRNTFTLGLCLTLCALLSGGCATAFSGSAYVANGRAGCEAKCQGQGLEFAGMVYMGEYSDACVCAVPGETASTERHMAQAAAVTAGSVGVMMAMQERQRQQMRMQQIRY